MSLRVFLFHHPSYRNLMPWQGRIGAPGALRHIAIREIETRAIFEDDKDREEIYSVPHGFDGT